MNKECCAHCIGYDWAEKLCENCDCHAGTTIITGEGISVSPVTTFTTGAIRDTQEGKLDFVETISFTALNRYASYMTSKKAKYGAGNFKKGIPIDSYEKSLMRHIDKYMRNKYESGNDEPDEDHLAAIIFNVSGIMHEEEMAKKTT